MNSRVAIITGAGSGIGRATALQLAEHGYQLALVGRTRASLLETVNLLRTESLVIEADLGDRQSPQRIAREALERFHRVDVLINNAALGPHGPIAECAWEELERTFAANVFGPACLIAALWARFVQQNGGRIINVSSMSTIDPFPGLVMYASSKAALESLARSVRSEGAAHNIRAFNIAPGSVETKMLRSIVSVSELPRERTLSPETVATLIVNCALGARDSESGNTIILPSP